MEIIKQDLNFAPIQNDKMIEIKKAFQTITEAEFNQLVDTPVWLALLAALSNDGEIQPSEKAEAVKLAHLRTFTSSKTLQEFYKKVDEVFASRFDRLHDRLPAGEHDKELYIEAMIKQTHSILLKLDVDVAEAIEGSFSSFYDHIFKSEKSFFQYFALPLISNRLDKQSGHYEV